MGESGGLQAGPSRAAGESTIFGLRSGADWLCVCVRVCVVNGEVRNI